MYTAPIPSNTKRAKSVICTRFPGKYVFRNVSNSLSSQSVLGGKLTRFSFLEEIIKYGKKLIKRI